MRSHSQPAFFHTNSAAENMKDEWFDFVFFFFGENTNFWQAQIND